MMTSLFRKFCWRQHKIQQIFLLTSVKICSK